MKKIQAEIKIFIDGELVYTEHQTDSNFKHECQVPLGEGMIYQGYEFSHNIKALKAFR